MTRICYLPGESLSQCFSFNFSDSEDDEDDVSDEDLSDEAESDEDIPQFNPNRALAPQNN